MKSLQALNKYFWKYRIRLGIGAIFIIISNYFAVLAPQLTGFVIDFVQKKIEGYQQAIRKPNYAWLIQKIINFIESKFSDNSEIFSVVILCGVTIILLALLRGFFMFLMRQTIIVMSRHIEYDQKNEVFNHYQQMDSSFFKANFTGDLMSRMSEDIGKVRMFTGPAVMYLINLITLISLSVFFMLKRDVELTAYVLAPLPILAITIYFVNTIINRKSERIQQLLASLTSNAQETYSGIRVIKSFVQEKTMLNLFTKKSEEYKKQSISLSKLEAIYFPSIAFLIGISTLLTIMIGGLYYINNPGRIGLETIVEFVIYINMLTFPVIAIGWTASIIQRAAASQRRVDEFLQISPKIKNAENAVSVLLNGKIQFRNVDFVYPQTGIQAIKNFNLTINNGDKVAIVGRTGSGKSTIAQLLLRMYDISTGSIEMNGIDIRNLDLKNLREQISYVPQDVFLFSDTIANNISFGVSKSTNEAIENAAKQASFHDDVNDFPLKYETIIGERGVMLSGGQKQRLSIARALIKDPQLIIFDDCLSAVDIKTEKTIIDNLYSFLRNKTAIIITHRIFSLFQFDKIIVIEEGEIVEEGTHEQLLKNNGYYTELYYRQHEKEDSFE